MITRAVLFERFAGRDEELRHLAELRNRASRDVRGGTVSISGEAGVGKSRLLREFARTKHEDDRSTFLRVRCDELPVAYAPFVRILEALSAMRDLGRSDIVTTAIETALQLLTTANTGPAPDALERKRLLFDRLVSAVGLSAKRLGQLTLAIEDVHWSDISSLEALRSLARAAPELPVALIFTYRMEELAADPVRALAIASIERESVDRVTLGPLAFGDIVALLRKPVPDASNELLRRIYELSEGLPYVAEELARSIVENGSGIDFAGTLTLRSAVLERVLQLSPNDRSIVDRAAVLGRNFAPEDLSALGASQNALFGALRAGLALQLFEEIDVAGKPWFRFRHALTREILYRNLLAIERRELHLGFAAHLENVGNRTAELAYHLAAAGDTKRAAVASERAGDEATGVAGFADAAKLYASSLDVVTDPESLARIARKLARSLDAVGDLDSLLASGSDVAEKLVAHGRLDDALDIYIIVVRALAPSRLVDARALFERLLTLAESETHEDVRFDIELTHSELLRWQIRNAEALEACARAEASVTTLTPKQRNAILLAQSTCYMRLNNLSRAQELLERRREGIGNGDADEAETSAALARVSYRRAELQTAMDHCLDAAARWQRAGRERASFLQRCNAALAASDIGNFAFVENVYEGARREGHEASEALEGARVRAIRAVGGDPVPLVERFESVLDSGTMYMTFMLGRDVPFIVYDDRALARSIAVRALDRIPAGDVDSEIAEAVAIFGSDDEVERAIHALAQNSHRENDIWFAAGNAIVAARVAIRNHRPLEAAEHARVALELATKMRHWLFLSSALSLAGNEAASRALLSRIGAVAELGRRERTRAIVREDPGLPKLTQREAQIAQYTCNGLSNREIADRLTIAIRTVETHLANVYAKFGIGSRAQLVEVLGPSGEA